LPAIFSIHILGSAGQISYIVYLEDEKMSKKDFIPVTFPNAPFGKYGLNPIETDPFGSYTGIPKEFEDMPIQDADDL